MNYLLYLLVITFITTIKAIIYDCDSNVFCNIDRYYLLYICILERQI